MATVVTTTKLTAYIVNEGFRAARAVVPKGPVVYIVNMPITPRRVMINSM